MATSSYRSWLGRLIYARRKERRNCIIVVHAQGETGVGKSFLCLRLAEKWDPHFSAERVVFDAEDFISLCQTLPPESIIVYDDAAATVDRSKWHDAVNLAIKYALQVFRKKRITVFFNCPHPKNLDTNVMVQSDAVMRVYKPGLAKVYTYTLNWIDNTSYTAVKEWLGDPDDVKNRIRPPSQKLIEEYEKRKDVFIADTLLKGKSEIRAEREKRKKKPNQDEIYKDIVARNNIDRYKSKRGKNPWNVALIGADYSCSSTKAYQVAAKLEDAHHYERPDKDGELGDSSDAEVVPPEGELDEHDD